MGGVTPRGAIEYTCRAFWSSKPSPGDPSTGLLSVNWHLPLNSRDILSSYWYWSHSSACVRISSLASTRLRHYLGTDSCEDHARQPSHGQDMCFRPSLSQLDGCIKATKDSDWRKRISFSFIAYINRSQQSLLSCSGLQRTKDRRGHKRFCCTMCPCRLFSPLACIQFGSSSLSSTNRTITRQAWLTTGLIEH
ncbi:hypothetical protein BU23DRAFT_183404 [Bimuria novae-zelandiae CBS 107.79]|uniref:Uncharacterized protein n=1 Tax=Bimuria novae-zelandiae CBS 107.79 TaxID=1447943 RepID=A0A6A5V3N3_9PLEO|nr:hypothetical protein BU23DRAFT_183404 [Bimuria novae-zelandiae CBS 107.79]